jgi:hypothetical protein
VRWLQEDAAVRVLAQEEARTGAARQGYSPISIGLDELQARHPNDATGHNAKVCGLRSSIAVFCDSAFVSRRTVSTAIVSDVGKGKERLITQYCVGCKSRKSMRGFDIGRGLCAECSADRAAQVSKKVPTTKARAVKPPSGPTSWKCPTCLKRIDVNDARTALVRHQNGRGDRCAGSGHQLPQRSTDALDYRVGGSFESGRR